ncbi:MAG: hypothetical protein R3B90_13050 [Planctomycetaceae bacterium]
MSRDILQACLPGFVALAVSSLLLVLVIRLSGGRWQLRRLRSLHRCEQGAVQTLSFVLTMPLLVMILLFIVQVSQLMIGIVVVNYAAFASARAASVWVPAHVEDGFNTHDWEDLDGQNELPPYIYPDTPYTLRAEGGGGLESRKLSKVWSAAALACAVISPSRSTADGQRGQAISARAADMTVRLYPEFDPAADSNDRIPTRLRNKLGYSALNTFVDFEYEDRNSQPVPGTRTYNPIAHPDVTYYPSEVGWQDPITITVYHDFALLPGPGRFLSKLLVRQDARADRVAPRVHEEGDVYKTRIFASATMTNEGLMSVRPYNHPAQP